MNRQSQSEVCDREAPDSPLSLLVKGSLEAGSSSEFPPEVRPDYKAKAKRLFDLCLSFIGLVLLGPLFVLIGALVKTDGGNIFYRQVRIGQGGREFVIYKFRSMVRTAERAGPSVTKDGDNRITWVGRLLRKAKLDELPQLWNVLKGDMSLVGPRPEVPLYVRHYTPEQRQVLRLKPGITDLASLCFRNEEALLANAENVEEFYIQHCIPRKLRLNQDYAKDANLLSDIWIILQTICPYWAAVMTCYGALLGSAFWLSYQLTYDFGLPHPASRFWSELAVVLGLQLGCLAWHTRCQALLSYFSFTELRQIGIALGLAAMGLLIGSMAFDHGPAPKLILINALLSICLLVSFRLQLRSWREHSVEDKKATTKAQARVGIIGAGSSGAQLALEFASNRRLARKAIAFFDDDFRKWQKHIHDVPVVGMPECLLEGWAKKLDEVVIAIPNAPAERMREIEKLLRGLPLKCYSAPSLRRIWDEEQGVCHSMGGDLIRHGTQST
jgi:lipopolysaccharide/colanic/teichoic acid biosynthesis glycosyltransferase